MKNVKSILSNRTFWVVCLVLVGTALYAQNGDYSGRVSSELTKAASSVKQWVRTIFDVVFGLGGLGLIFAFVMKNNDAKQWLLYYVGGIVIYGIVRALFL